MNVNRSRWIDLLCVLSLLLYAWCGLRQARVGAVNPEALPTAWPARVAGALVAGPEEARFRIEAFRPGTTVTIESAAGLRSVPVRAAHGFPHVMVTSLTGLLFWVACTFAFATRVRQEPARAFFWASLTYGLAILCGDAYFPPSPVWPNLIVPLLRLACLVAVPILFLHITTVFPQPAPRPTTRRLLVGITALGVLLFAVEAGAFVAAVTGGSPAAFPRFIMAERLADAFLVVVVLTGFLQLVRASRRSELAREREQAKWIWWGVLVGTTPFVLLHALPRVFGFAPLLPIEIVRLFAIAVPLSFAVAIARYRFLDIDLIIRRSLIYGTMAALLTGAYLVLGVALGRRLGGLDPRSIDLLQLAVFVVAIVLFEPMRRRIGGWVDRTFFKLRTGLDQAAHGFRASLARVADPDELARRTGEFLQSCLGPRVLGTITGTGTAATLHGDLWARLPGSPQDTLEALVLASPRARAVPGATAEPEIEDPDFPADLRSGGVVLLQPLVGDAGVVGALVLGEKRNERRYVEEETALLAEVGAEAGRALERIHLVRHAAEESMMRSRLAELDRRKAAFLAQVAHDLRTPLTSILWSSENLLDGVGGELAEIPRDYVRSIRTSAAHLGRLVGNLLDIARLDNPDLPVRLEPVDAASVAEEAAVALGPLARGRGLEIDVQAVSGLPPVRAQRDGLMKVVLNLLDNALKFGPSGSRVEIEVARAAEGGQRVAVLDRGPGVPEAERLRIFEAYRDPSSATSAHAAGGLGLGLGVVRGWLDRFGGSVEVEAREGGGAAFVCRLHEWTPGGDATERPTP